MFKKPTTPHDGVHTDDEESGVEIRRPTGATVARAVEAPPVQPVEPVRDTKPETRIPTTRTHAQTTVAHSLIDEFLTMRGDIETEGNVHIKGRVFGNVKCVSIIVEDGALVSGEIQAEEVIVRGQTQGAISARLVRLEATAIVESDIYHKSFACEQGARIQGQLSYRDDESTQPQANDPANRKGAMMRHERNGAAPKDGGVNGHDGAVG